MKLTSSAFVIAALLGACCVEGAQAVKISTTFTDDLMKSLTEDMQKESNGETEQTESAPAAEQPKAEPTKKEEKKAAKKNDKKDEKKTEKKEAKKSDKKEKKKEDKKEEKKDTKKKKEDEPEIPMDMAAIKAYSSVIADAAEDSTPAVAVVYHETIQPEEKQQKADIFVGDPMASMIQNEISSIKDASIAAAKEE